MTCTDIVNDTNHTSKETVENATIKLALDTTS